jgi:hypothetical protein
VPPPDELAGEQAWGHSGDAIGFQADLLLPPEVAGNRRGAGQLPGRRHKPRQAQPAEKPISDVRALGP